MVNELLRSDCISKYGHLQVRKDALILKTIEMMCRVIGNDLL